MELSPNYSKRVYGLDVMRAIAILLVVHVHGGFMLAGTALEKFPWIRLVDGVELFFVLSGFLIGGILIKIIHQNHYQLSMSQMVNFWKRRWFRTLPNYYLILIINIILAKHALIGGNIEHFNYKFFLFIQNFSEPFVGFFWESWSLSIEEWFYIFLPLALILSLKLFPSKKGILLAIIILILAPLVYRVMHSSENVNFFWWDVKFRKVILMRLDTIIFGVLAAYIKFYHLQIWKKYAVFSFIIGMILIISISYLPIEINDFFTKTFYFSLISFAAMLLLPYADSMKSFSTFFGKIITHISLISYSMYLVNLSLVSSIIRINFPVSDPMNGLLKYFLYWFIVISISTLLYLFFEKPMMNLRDKNIFTRKKSIRQL